MGDPLIHVKMAAFQDELQNELQKEAFNPFVGLGKGIAGKTLGIGKGLYNMGMKARYRGPEQAHELLDRVLSPRKGLLKGWNQMSQRGAQQAETARRARIIEKMQASGKTPEEIQKIMGRDPAVRLQEAVSKAQAKGKKPWFGEASAAHLTQHMDKPVRFTGKQGIWGQQLQGGAINRFGQRVKGTAEELSRRGWTGGGRVTKYVPMGDKGITAGFAGMSIPAVVNAQKAYRTGEGGSLEAALGEAGSTLGFVGGGGLGPITGIGASMGLHSAGSKLGRTLDRLRAGASLREAWSAPTPTEAAKQLSQIQKYYG